MFRIVRRLFVTSLLVLAGFSAVSAQTPAACDLDVLDAIHLLLDVQAASQAGDDARALELLTEARQQLATLEDACHTSVVPTRTPVLEETYTANERIRFRYPENWSVLEDTEESRFPIDAIYLGASDEAAQAGLNGTRIDLVGQPFIQMLVGSPYAILYKFGVLDSDMALDQDAPLPESVNYMYASLEENKDIGSVRYQLTPLLTQDGVFEFSVQIEGEGTAFLSFRQPEGSEAAVSMFAYSPVSDASLAAISLAVGATLTIQPGSASN